MLAIDPYDADVEGETGEARKTVFEANLRGAGVFERVTLRRAYSHDVAGELAPESLGVLFIDGSHEYADVLQDVDDWVPKMVPGAYVLLNDPAIPAVSWAIRDRVGRRGSPLRRSGLLTNTLFTKYEPGKRWAPADELRRARLRLGLPFAWRLVRLVDRLGAGSRGEKLAAHAAYRSGRLLLTMLLPPPRTSQL